jgi:hypothetical protein
MKTFVVILLGFIAFAGCTEEVATNKPMKPTVGVFLAKANDNLISHCNCQETFIGAPAQMQCPWCGCGWLFVCPKCRKAFTFARAEMCDLTWQQLAHRDLDGKYGKQPSQDEIDEWIGFMKMLTKDIQLGNDYAYIDGWIFPTSETQLQFEGMHARHELDVVPQAAALSDRQSLEQTLGNRRYWDERKLDQE